MIVVVVAPHKIEIVFTITWQTKINASMRKNMESGICSQGIRLGPKSEAPTYQEIPQVQRLLLPNPRAPSYGQARHMVTAG